MIFRVAQISDTHLSAEKPFFVRNFECVSRELRIAAPDLVINTGDVSLNGAAGIGDLHAAKALHDTMGLSYRVIPGNHDVGDNVQSTHERGVSDARRDRFVAVFGDDWWVQDVPGWRLVGVNSLIMDADLPAAARQFAFIADAASGAGDRAVMLFIHKPLYLRSRHDRDPGGRYVSPSARARLLQAFSTRPPAVIASGHVHQWRHVVLEGMQHVWAPATSFVMPPAHQVTIGERVVGYVEHRLHASGAFDCRIAKLPALICNDLADFPGAYGDIARILPKLPTAGA